MKQLPLFDGIKTQGSAFITADRQYRYWLRRPWANNDLEVCWVMINPSTANAEEDDPTTRRCIDFSVSHGFGSMVIVNLYAFITPYPDELFKRRDEGKDIVGPENDTHILKQLADHPTVIAAWGADKRVDDARVQFVRANATSLYCLQKGKGGTPSHPARLSSGLKLKRWP